MRQVIIISAVIFSALFGFRFFFPSAFAQSLFNLEATVKISVCGNLVVEGGEDCEGSDLAGQTCEGLDFGPGTLVCDIACSFDTSGCSLVPTATSIPAPGPTATPGPSSTSTPAPVATATPIPTPAIPAVVALFDIDGSGRIEVTEVFASVKSWVDEWKQALMEEIKIAKGEIISEPAAKKSKKCDINRDKKCDLFDLSILLYYIGK